MFNLESLIDSWKYNLQSQGTLRADDIDELEQHLRASIVELCERGLTVDEAYLVATKRLGDDKELQREFTKVNGGYIWCSRAMWMIAGYLGMLFLGKLIGLASELTLITAIWFLADSTAVIVASVAATMIGWAIIGIAFYQLGEQGLRKIVRRLKRIRTPLLIVYAVLFVLLCQVASMLGNVVAARMAPASFFGEVALAMSGTNLALQFVIPVVCLFFILGLRRRLQTC